MTEGMNEESLISEYQQITTKKFIIEFWRRPS